MRLNKTYLWNLENSSGILDHVTMSTVEEPNG